MSSTEPGFEHRDAERPANEFPVEVWSLLQTISSQIDEADQRHTGLLQDLRERLAQLGQAAENVRANVPEGAAPVYSRIEDGLAKLAHQIDAMEDMAVGTDRAGVEPPAALKSASNRDVAPAHTVSASGFDPFDVVGDDDGDTPWNAADAEALSRVYEESDAALVRLTPRTDAAAAQPAGEPAADPLLAFGGAAAPQSAERDWLEHRLSDIAARIEQSLAEFRGDFTMEKLGSRFEAFETHLGTVLGDVATRTDLESLRILEGQVQDLASHLEQAEQQLGRLDGIEQQLQAVIDHLSAEAEGSGSGGVASETPDFKSLASVTAEEVAQRFAAQINGAGNSGDPRIDELGSLLRSMIHDRRHSDDQTYAMLDTVQQAMIRLLDRIDALEMAQIQSPQRAPASATIETAAVEDFGAPEPTAPAVPRQPAATASAASITPPLAAVPSSVDKLRQDFIADAQRAKSRAAAAAAEAELTATMPATPSARMARGTPRVSLPPVMAPDVQGSGGSSRKQRLTALALCLVIAVSGAALFAKSRTPAQPAATPAAVTKTVPGDAVSPTAEDVLGDGGIDVPAAPKNMKAATKPASGAPAPVEGAGFEAPADEPAAVPAPVPQPVPAAEAPSAAAPVAGPQTNEGVLEFDEEMPSSGEVNEGTDSDEVPQNESSAPKGIILQDNGRVPTARELVQLQSQQNVAALSSRLGRNASRLSPADLMPEEVAKHSVTRIAAGGDDITAAQPVPASLSVAALPGETVDVPATDPSKTFSQLSLPPATVGPLSLRLAAANGDPSAAFEVGARLAEGKGTNQNFHEAIIWYQKSASQGFAQSQYRLGTLYERGLGVKADVARAQMWYQRAAEQGHVKAMHNLAVLSAGRSSGQPDYATASVWFEKAANYGLADSQYNLAVLHENGLGVAKDFVRAYKWYSLAGQGGDAEAMRRRDVLKAQLTADQRLQAENAVAAFVPERTIPLVNDARVAGEDWKKRQDG